MKIVEGSPIKGGKLEQWWVLCNICGEPLTIYPWLDRDVFVDPCENCRKGGD